MNHKPRRLLGNCLRGGRRQILFFLFFFLASRAFHWQASDGLPTKKGVNKQAHVHVRLVCGINIKQRLQRRRFAGGQPPSFCTSTKMARSLPLARSAPRYAAETGLGDACFPAEVKSTGALIIMALIGINRERDCKRRRRPGRQAPPGSLVQITRTAGALLKAEVENNAKSRNHLQDSFSTQSITGGKPAISFISQPGHKNRDAHFLFQVITSSNLVRRLPVRIQF